VIHLLFQCIFWGLLPATAFMAWCDRRRGKHMVRLEALLALEAGHPAAAPPRRMPAILENLLPRTLLRNLRQLGFVLAPRRIAAGSAGLAVCAIAVGAFAGAMAAAGVVAAALLVAWACVNIMAARRITKFADQLPGFLDRLRQMLVVGNSLPTAFGRALQSSQSLTVEFLEPVIRRAHNGVGFSDSIRQSAEDIDLHEMRLFATTVTANARFGGSLSQTLNNLVLYLRKRAAIERELRANTAQIRASAWVLGLLPLVVAMAIMLQNREYAAWFITNTAGKKMLAYCLVSQVAGAFFMRMIVRTKF
jgi:tight adherence protein B